jgi:SAM-dependent methyltransferase
MMSQIVRYAPVIELIAERRPRSVLEVGSGSQGLGRFLARRFVGVERDFTDYTPAVQRPSPWMLPVCADAARVPFRATTFDLVLMIDVLEHVPPAARAELVSECVRVARDTIAVGFPSGPLAESHDRELDRWLDERKLPRPGWLAEHLEHPFPTAGEIAGLFAGAGARVRIVENAWLPAHRAFIRWETRPRGAAYSALLADLLAPTEWDWRRHRPWTNGLRLGARPLAPLLRLLDRRPAYRTLIVAERAEARGDVAC